MSPINFDHLLTEYPEYADCWTALRDWFDSNSRKRYVELSVLVRSLRNLDKIKLILAINTMVEEDMLKMAYRVKAPDGDLLEKDFDRPDIIPKELPDRSFSGRVRTEEADIVSGYRWEPADAA